MSDVISLRQSRHGNERKIRMGGRAGGIEKWTASVFTFPFSFFSSSTSGAAAKQIVSPLWQIDRARATRENENMMEGNIL